MEELDRVIGLNCLKRPLSLLKAKPKRGMSVYGDYISPFVESKCPNCGGRLSSSAYVDVCIDCDYGESYPTLQERIDMSEGLK